jgi:hypothetical protein
MISAVVELTVRDVNISCCVARRIPENEYAIGIVLPECQVSEVRRPTWPQRNAGTVIRVSPAPKDALMIPLNEDCGIVIAACEAVDEASMGQLHAIAGAAACGEYADPVI